MEQEKSPRGAAEPNGGQKPQLPLMRMCGWEVPTLLEVPGCLK